MHVDLPPELLLEGAEGVHVVGRLVGLHPYARAEALVWLGHVIRKAEHAKALLQSRFNIPPLAGLGVPATVGVGVVVRFHMGSVPHLEKIMQIWVLRGLCPRPPHQRTLLKKGSLESPKTLKKYYIKTFFESFEDS